MGMNPKLYFPVPQDVRFLGQKGDLQLLWTDLNRGSTLYPVLFWFREGKGVGGIGFYWQCVEQEGANSQCRRVKQRVLRVVLHQWLLQILQEYIAMTESKEWEWSLGCFSSMKGFCPHYLEKGQEDIRMNLNVLTEQYLDIYPLCLYKDSLGLVFLF